MAKEINFVRPEEVYEDGVSMLRYKGYDGNYHTILPLSAGGNGNVQRPLLISDLAKVVNVDTDNVEFSVVTSYPRFAETQTDYEEPTPAQATTDATRITLETNNDEMFNVGDTIVAQGIYGYNESGTMPTLQQLVLYVVSRDEDDGLMVQAVNGKKIGTVENCVPSIGEGTLLLRMGRALGEMDVQTSPMNAVPATYSNYCQIFKCQIEESLLVENASKSVDWTLKDMEEQALADMIESREENYIFGVKNIIWDNVKHEDIKITQGIQLNKSEFVYNRGALNLSTSIASLLSKIFSYGESKVRYLFASNALMADMFPSDRINENNIITSAMGDVVVVPCPVVNNFDRVKGIVVAPEHLTRYVNIPLKRQVIDKSAQGETNSKAVIYTESSCLVCDAPKTVVFITET